MSTITRALATGYRFQNFHDYPSLAQETPAYSATLTHEGRPVAQVTSDGGGGAAVSRYVDVQARTAFQAAARDLADEDRLAEEELLGLLYEHALLAQAITREAGGRVVVQLEDDGEVWEGGAYRILPAGYGAATAVRAELRRRYDGAKVWNPRTGEFTPA